MRLTVICFVLVLALMPAAALAMPSCSMTFSEDDLSFSEYVHGDDTFQIPGGDGGWVESPSVESIFAR